VPNQKIKKYILLALGTTCLALGILGIFLPLLPTTPFLLLAAACYMRSSGRLYRWLIEHRYLGSYIRNYHEHKAITRRALVAALITLWVAMGYVIIWIAQHVLLRLSLLVIAVAVTVHLLRLNKAT